MPISKDSSLKLFFAPYTRAFTTLWLLEEMNLDYQLDAFDLKTGRHKQADYLALNPMGKVPVVMDGEIPVSEGGAIAVYLGDRFPETKIAPAVHDRDRAAYLRWAFFCSGVLEPAYAERFAKAEPKPSNHAWGSFDQMLAVATKATEAAKPFLLGETISAADILLASGLRFGILFGIIPPEGPVNEYVNRMTSRDSFVRAKAIEDKVIAGFSQG